MPTSRMGRVWLDRREHRGPTVLTASERVWASRGMPRCGWSGRGTKTLETRTAPAAVISPSSVSAWPSNSESRVLGKAGAASARPQHALLPLPNRAYALVDEFLHALAFVSLRGIEVALGVGGDAVHAVELARLATAVAEVGDFLERVAKDDAHLLVLAVGEEHEPLLAVL